MLPLLPLALLALLCSTGGVYAADSRWTGLADVSFQHLGLDKGLPHSDVMALTQDSTGFMWFGTQDGLARWDGYRFRVFQPDPKNPDSLPDNYIRVLHVDGKQRLWVGTGNGGIAWYDPEKEQFKRIGTPQLSHVSVQALLDDGVGGLWVGTRGGLDHLTSSFLNATPGEPPPAIEHIQHHEQANSPLPHEVVNALLLDRRHRLWVGTDGGLVWRDKGSSQFKPFALPKLASDKPFAVTSLFQASDGRIWIGSKENGVFVLDEAAPENTVQPFDGHLADGHLMHETIQAICEGNPGQIWISTAGQGVVVADDHGAVRRLRHDTGFNASISDDYVWGVFRDRSGLIWIGSQRGVNFHDPAVRAIKHLFGGSQRPGAIIDSDVTSVHVGSDGRVWLGLLKSGVQIINPDSGQIDWSRPDSSHPTSALPASQVYAIATDKQGQAYIATERGLYHSDAHGRQMRYLGTPGGAVMALQMDGERLWLGSNDGVWQLDLNSSGHAPFHPVPVNATIEQKVRSISVLQRDQANGLWIGTNYQGLYHYDLNSGKLRHFAMDRADPQSLSHNAIASILIDSRGRLWVGTQGGGINLALPASADGKLRFARIGQEQGLSNLLVNKLLEDGQGRIWASTDGGLAWIDPARQTAHAISRSQGGAMRVYWINSGDKSANGELLFGGAGGLSVVESQLPAAASFVAPVVITQLQVGGKELVAAQFNQSGTNPLQIQASANSIAVEFSALDYASPELNRFAFKLDGYDPEWINTDISRRRAAYTNLPPGDYRLRLRGSNRHGEWTEAERVLAFTVLPAWHQTWWSRVLAVLLLCLIMTALIQRRTRYLRQRQLELETQVAQRTEQLQQHKQQLETANQELSSANADLAQSMTRLQQAQLQLVRQEKLASLGTLTAGIAHEINNPSNFAHVGAYVLGNDLAELRDFLWQLAGDDVEPDVLRALQTRFDKLTQSLASVSEGTTRIRDLVRDLRTFSRLDESDWKAVHVADSLQATINLVRTQYANLVEFRCALDANPEIECSPAQLNQVFMNLIVNACQAIAAREPEIQAKAPGLLCIASRIEQDCLLLEFEDNGGGIPADIIERIFDPFFTTKTVGDGMGMGLAISHGIIEKHRGSIMVSSVEAVGSCFRIRLPLAGGEGQAATVNE
jgi:signal transduction histidine kinase/ligand-binding sensor domain-containing protein